MGVQTLIGRVPASASIEERAKVLCQMIGEKFPGQDVNLIGHSMVRAAGCLQPCEMRGPLRKLIFSLASFDLHAGRARRPIPHLAPQTDQFPRPVSDNHLDAPSRLFFRRLPPRGYRRRREGPGADGGNEGARSSRWRESVRRFDHVCSLLFPSSAEILLPGRVRNCQQKLTCGAFNPAAPRWPASTKRRRTTRTCATSRTARTLSLAGRTLSGSRGVSCTSAKVSSPGLACVLALLFRYCIPSWNRRAG